MTDPRAWLDQVDARDDPALVAAYATTALRAVLDLHTPIDALLNPGRYERVVKVCTGCGTDDGNWQRHPCPTVKAVTTALEDA